MVLLLFLHFSTVSNCTIGSYAQYSTQTARAYRPEMGAARDRARTGGGAPVRGERPRPAWELAGGAAVLPPGRRSTGGRPPARPGPRLPCCTERAAHLVAICVVPAPEKHSDFVNTGQLITTTYTKPYHIPQYLHFLSSHKHSCKTSISKGEIARFLINNNTASGFQRGVLRLNRGLFQRGHPKSFERSDVGYDTDRRLHLLQKLASRDRHAKKDTCSSFSLQSSSSPSVLCVTTYSDVRVPFCKFWDRLNGSLYKNSDWRACNLHLAKPKIGYRNNTSLFLKYYRYNLPIFQGRPG